MSIKWLGKRDVEKETLSNLPVLYRLIFIYTNHHQHHQALFSSKKLMWMDKQYSDTYSFCVCLFMNKTFQFIKSVTLFIPLICIEPRIQEQTRILAMSRGWWRRLVIGHKQFFLKRFGPLTTGKGKWGIEDLTRVDLGNECKDDELGSIFLTTQCGRTMRNILSSNRCTINGPQSKSSIVSW